MTNFRLKFLVHSNENQISVHFQTAVIENALKYDLRIKSGSTEIRVRHMVGVSNKKSRKVTRKHTKI